MTTNEPMVAAYWHENPQRWVRALRVAADIADMYELERPDDREFDRLPVWALPERFFWHTTHQQGLSKIPGGVVSHDQMLDIAPEYDAPTAWACIVGELMSWLLTGADLRFILDTSGSRVMAGEALWKSFSPDFRTMLLGLSGDMRKQGLRGLVLGYYDRGRDV